MDNGSSCSESKDALCIHHKIAVSVDWRTCSYIVQSSKSSLEVWSRSWHLWSQWKVLLSQLYRRRETLPVGACNKRRIGKIIYFLCFQFQTFHSLIQEIQPLTCLSLGFLPCIEEAGLPHPTPTHLPGVARSGVGESLL